MAASARRAEQPRSVRAAVAFVLATGLLACLSQLSQALMTLAGRFVWTAGGADPRKPLEHLPQLLQADIREGYSLYLEDIPAWLRALSAAPSVIYAITVALAALLVARILLRIASGDAFGQGVRQALTRLSLVLVGGGVLHGVADTVAVAMLWGHLPRLSEEMGGEHATAVEALGIDIPHWPVMLILLGLVAGALTLAFRQGARLREEMVGVI